MPKVDLVPAGAGRSRSRRVTGLVVAATCAALAVAGCSSSSSTAASPSAASGSAAAGSAAAGSAAAGSAPTAAGSAPASAAANGAGQVVKVGAFAFPEGQLLANLYVDALNKAGFKAQVVQTESRETGEPALSQGSLDVLPEYTSSMLDYLKASSSTSNDAANLALLTKLAAAKGVTVADRAPATDNYAFGVATSFATAHKLVTLSDLAAYSKNNPVAVAGIQECADRSYCLAGLKSTYGLNVSSFKVTVLASQASVDLLLKNTVQLVQFDSSDGVIAANPITILKDDKSLNHSDFIIPAVNTKAATPALISVLNGVSAKLTQAVLNDSNKSVQVDRVPAADAATALFAKIG